MKEEELNNIISLVSKGDTSAVEELFDKPGGRRFLENIVLLLVCRLECETNEKEHLLKAFDKILNKLEKRIAHKKAGEQILQQAYR